MFSYSTNSYDTLLNEKLKNLVFPKNNVVQTPVIIELPKNSERIISGQRGNAELIIPKKDTSPIIRPTVPLYPIGTIPIKPVTEMPVTESPENKKREFGNERKIQPIKNEGRGNGTLIITSPLTPILSEPEIDTGINTGILTGEPEIKTEELTPGGLNIPGLTSTAGLYIIVGIAILLIVYYLKTKGE